MFNIWPAGWAELRVVSQLPLNSMLGRTRI
jgi:hypothetical protein